MLLAAVADLAPVALVAALSPFPLVAAIVAAGAANPATGAGLAAGWVAGLGVLTTILVFAAGEIDPTSITPDAWVQILVGLALLAAAVWKWRTRPRRGQPVEAPRWMSSLGDGPARAFGIGAALGAVNPKHLALALAAAAIVHYHGLSGTGAALAALAFVAIGSSTVLAIVSPPPSAARRHPRARPPQALHAAPQQHHHGGDPRRHRPEAPRRRPADTAPQLNRITACPCACPATSSSDNGAGDRIRRIAERPGRLHLFRSAQQAPSAARAKDPPTLIRRTPAADNSDTE